MKALSSRPAPLICVVGPTCSGKTAAALHLADLIRQEGHSPIIINADSRQTYHDFPIITAQPTAKEQALCPHLLYGYLPTADKSSAGRWAERTRAALTEVFRAEGLPLLVGGTGLYLRALLDGMADIPTPDPTISARLENERHEQGANHLYAKLMAVDPAYALRIHPNDKQRVIRALEVWESTGKTFTDWHRATPPAGLLGLPDRLDQKTRVLRLGVGLPLPELTPLLTARVHAMLQAGAMDEASAALLHCPDTTAPGWSGIGCAEIAAHLTGKLSLDACVELWSRNTRAYAKRQWTWFRADGRIQWHRPGEFATMDRAVLKFLKNGTEDNEKCLPA